MQSFKYSILRTQLKLKIMSLDFTNKVVIVTGSSAGIGAAIAIELVKRGGKVVITGRSGDRLKSVEKKCQEVATIKGKAVLAIVADVTNEEDLRNLVDSTVQEFGQLDILINNAGAGGTAPIADPTAISNYDNIISTNLRSVFVITHLAIPHLVKTKGNIVNISSLLGTRPMATYSSYCMSKAALDMFTQCLALEVGPQGVRVNCVKPGVVATNFQTAMGMPSELVTKFKVAAAKASPIGRYGTPEDISNLVLFLASPLAVNMTGSLVISDSGSQWGPAPDLSGIF